MNNAIARRGNQELKLYNPEQGLKTIATSEAGEKHWRQAKDATKLMQAVEAKIIAQADYVVWRDAIVKPSRELPGAGRGKGKRVAGLGPSKLPDADPGKRVIERWRKKLCRKDGGKGTKFDQEKINLALADARQRCIRICEQQNITTVRGTEGTGEFERYTPKQYIDAARKVLGEIDLDPASCKEAQKVVQAKQYYTEKNDGLAREWHGRVWLNPPYHRYLMPNFVGKLIEEFKAGRVSEAILLTNNCTDTDWFQAAASMAKAICFTNGRISFGQPNGLPMGLPTQGQAFFYFGDDVAGFANVFRHIGFGVVPSWQYEETEKGR